MKLYFFSAIQLLCILSSYSFTQRLPSEKPVVMGKTIVKGFMDEFDNFLDDAFSRRLGNGAAFYGKRKSGFYGNDDKWKKQNPNAPDPSEDYQGPSSGSLFKWMEDETGRMVPVTRRKNRNIERSQSYWDKVYTDNEK